MKQKIKMFSQSETVEELLKDFLEDCKIRNLSQKTIKFYDEKFNKFISVCDISGIDIEQINKRHLISFISFFQDKGTKATTINCYLRAIRTIFNYGRNELKVELPTIKLLKETKRLIEVYTAQELKRLLSPPNLKEVSFNEYKTYVLESFLLGTGCRISTALAVKNRDVDFEAGIIKFTTTKNRKEQIVPLGSTLAKILRQYQKIRKGTSGDFLFCNSYGEQADLRTTQEQIADYNKQHGVQKTSCHLFRHTFATEYLKNGGNIYTLSQILGHSSISITENYLHFVQADLKADFSRLNPLDNINTKKKLSFN